MPKVVYNRQLRQRPQRSTFRPERPGPMKKRYETNPCESVTVSERRYHSGQLLFLIRVCLWLLKLHHRRRWATP